MNSSLLINQGTNSPVNFDANGGTFTQVIGIGYGTVSTIGTIPNLPGGTLNNLASGTINSATVTGNVGVSSGTINVSTISTLPNIPGGTINLATIAGNLGTIGTIGLATVSGNVGVSSGTFNLGTITGNLGTIGTIGLATVSGNLGTIGTIGLATVTGNVGVSSGTINVSTISTLPNLPQGSINVTAGTMSAGTLNTGTINTGTFVMPSGTITVLPNLPQGSINVTAGTVNAGTINVSTISAGTIRDVYDTIGTFTITLGTLASSSSGVGRQASLIDNTANLYQSAIIGVQITPGTSTGTALISFYLIRSDNGGGPIMDDKAGASDAAWTQLNAPLLYNMVVGAGTNVQYQNVFDTGPYRLGPKWTIGVVQNLGNPLNPTAGSHSITYTGIRGQFK